MNTLPSEDANPKAPIVTVYTDGACDPNPGPGGWGAILQFGAYEKEISGSEPDTTNNRMELQATIEALRALKRPCQVELYTDSEYLRQGITEWLPKWQASGWRTEAKKTVANQDLWEQLVEAMSPHTVAGRWVKGHTGNILNERVDGLARSAIPAPALPVVDPQAVHLFTGASCQGPGGPGAWAVVLRQPVLCRAGTRSDQAQTLSGWEGTTTANRLQVMAVAQGLQAVSGAGRVHVYTPSNYVQQGASLWLTRWKLRGWKTKDGQPVKNKDMWQAIVDASIGHGIRWHVAKAGARPQEMIQARELASQIVQEMASNQR